MQFFGGMTASAAPLQRGDVSFQPLYVEVVNAVDFVDFGGVDQVEVTNWPYETDVTGGPTLWVYCTNCN